MTAVSKPQIEERLAAGYAVGKGVADVRSANPNRLVAACRLDSAPVL